MDIRKEISARGYISLVFLGVLLSIVIWSALTYTGIVKPLFLPTPTKVINAAVVLFTQFDLISDILVSIYRIMIGFALAVIISIPLGILVGTIKPVEAFLEPLVAFIRYIPPSAYIPLSILWFGISDIEKFFIIFIVTAPYMLLMVADVVSKTKKELIEAGYTLGATTSQIYTKVIIPYSMPGIWDVIRILSGVSWTFIIMAEIIAATSGLGHVLIQSQRFLKTDNVVAVMLIIGTLGLLTDYLFKYTYKKFFPWSEKGGS